ncbi:induced myeloid leukemia cell differentiation protein Mcl-1b [Hoplias malabaricus]|uniref:induced myeloid leukemia cell differentiation protein Mcl-1b n=1 Tax=Hoplias malabaricus TaxID=27720 RepID=UPI00346354D2
MMMNPQDMCFVNKAERPNLVPFLPGRGFSLGLSSERAEVRNCSLPTSPVSDCEELHTGDGFPKYDAVDANTPEIINDFLQNFCGLSASCGRHGEVVQTMRRMVDGLTVKHELVYKGMLSKLNMKERGDDMSVVRTVAKDLFGDGITNWGRIASLLAFGGIVCRHQIEMGRGHCVSLVGRELSSYLLSDQKDWLLNNKAWDGFVEFFHVPDPESKMRNALMAFVTVAGLGAGIAFLSR